MSDNNSELRDLLRQQLLQGQTADAHAVAQAGKGEQLEEPLTGTALSSAYEQLRNATEYAEEHLLLQRAIKRFCHRNLFILKRDPKELGRELVVELVQAGYLPAGRYGSNVCNRISKLFATYLEAHTQLRKQKVTHDTSIGWVLACIANEVEAMLIPHSTRRAIIVTAYQHFLSRLPKDEFVEYPDNTAYELCLYIAVHQALLKSDVDAVRYDLLTLYQKSPSDTHEFRLFNEEVDKLYRSELTHELKRSVSRYGAPFRILKSLVDENENTTELLNDKHDFMVAYRQQIAREYKRVGERIDRGLLKSIVFIVITKLLIGIAIEIPYDKIVHGSVDLLPLAINLLFPPVYMASLKFGLHPPSKQNARLVEDYTERLLYGDKPPEVRRAPRRTYTLGARLLSALLFIVPIVLTVLVLDRLGFNIMQMIIFFVFFSTASFLGFRLSTIIRELELSRPQTGLLSSLRDTFYLPFILVGQWLSRKYGDINLVARFLDLAIELPLKTILRQLRLWIRFLNEKREELY
jgi:hypothetical protein